MAYETKTKPTAVDVNAFIEAVDSESKRADSRELLSIMEEATGEPATMWGTTIIGFGSYHYQYESGHGGDAPLLGFSPRKAALSLYVLGEFDGQDELLGKLGKFTVGKSCLWVKKLDDIDRSVLREMIDRSLVHTRATWPASDAVSE